MNDARAQDFWAWSLDRYARPGVEETLLVLQDRRGLDVCLLLWCAWRAERGDVVDRRIMAQAVALAEPWSREVTGRLRAVRRALKTARPEAVAAGAPALREAVGKLELEAERAACAMLDGLAPEAPPTGASPDAADAGTQARRNFAAYLAAAGRASEADAEIRALLDALAARLFACSAGP
ncbi:TIGR02444 family protein [Amphiplicatus metriothermophilus]|uniref:TIGR02444 family protein n=1 Tax=Amphiplicatus metriothermophilus TaxID=1519374 RepID=A0A239PPN2_9PROT|nr:TIGR02444 family protein [Amphiplicatus metriothermophilus]MBB5518577.1 uncharacterized protein (TIGR02444 family) [Amphiplicatus metriothermophilus]SNT72264.1 TIGR02444 family protein [Amphiplicatus metriothermophilus]